MRQKLQQEQMKRKQAEANLRKREDQERKVQRKKTDEDKKKKKQDALNEKTQKREEAMEQGRKEAAVEEKKGAVSPLARVPGVQASSKRSVVRDHNLGFDGIKPRAGGGHLARLLKR